MSKMLTVYIKLIGYCLFSYLLYSKIESAYIHYIFFSSEEEHGAPFCGGPNNQLWHTLLLCHKCLWWGGKLFKGPFLELFIIYYLYSKF